MELTEKEIELIELYKEGQLDEDAKSNLEARMASDPVFKSEVQFCIAIFDSLEMMSISVIRDKINIIKGDTPKPNTFFNKYKSVFISIGLILLFLFTILIIRNIAKNPVKDNVSFADSFFDPYPALGILRNSSSERNIALELYASGKYQEAITIWEKEISFKNDDFYLGVAYIATDQPEDALRTLEQINPEETDIPINTIQWYISLAKVKSGAVQSALPLLRAMEPPFKEKADSLLQMI